MQKYKDLSGNSGVLAYEAGSDYIKVQFKNSGESYIYNYFKPGKLLTEKMKVLAEEGKGLSTFISRLVKENYAAKLQ